MTINLPKKQTKLFIQKNVELTPLTTLRVGGTARFFVEAETEEEIIRAIKWATAERLPIFVLGSGSNVLISDKGFDGLVLKILLKGIQAQEPLDGKVAVIARAGENWDAFCEFCVRKNLAGVECLSGIPGSVGGTPVQNVGAYGQEVSETISSVKVFERKTGKVFEMSNTDCKFSYRASVFNTTEKDEYIVLAVTFCLAEGGKPKIEYADLKNFFGEKQPTLAETRQAVIDIRARKSMVIIESDPNSRSVGSFFKNPIVSLEKFAEIKTSARRQRIIARGENLPHYPVGETRMKIPAAWLIEKSGFYKGFEFGRVGLSTKHTLAIVNRGGASAQDVLDLKEKIQAGVKEKFGIELKAEPVFIGFRES